MCCTHAPIFYCSIRHIDYAALCLRFTHAQLHTHTQTPIKCYDLVWCYCCYIILSFSFPTHSIDRLESEEFFLFNAWKLHVSTRFCVVCSANETDTVWSLKFSYNEPIFEIWAAPTFAISFTDKFGAQKLCNGLTTNHTHTTFTNNQYRCFVCSPCTNYLRISAAWYAR